MFAGRSFGFAGTYRRTADKRRARIARIVPDPKTEALRAEAVSWPNPTLLGLIPLRQAVPARVRVESKYRAF